MIEMEDSEVESIDDYVFWKAMITALIIFSSALGVWGPRIIATKSEAADHILSFCNCFSGGVVFGVAMIHIMPEAVEEMEDVYPELEIPVAFYGCVGGFMLLVFVENMMVNYHTPNTEDVEMVETSSVIQSELLPTLDHPNSDKDKFTSYALMCALCLHSVIEGFALGIMTTAKDIMLLTIAILSHKAVAAFALGCSMNKAKLEFKPYFILSLIFTLATPIGTFLAVIILVFLEPSGTSNAVMTAVMNSIASGTFLYIATMEIFAEELNGRKHFLAKYSLAVLGIVIMAIVSIYS